MNAHDFPPQFSSLLGRILPLQAKVNVDVDALTNTQTEFNIIAVPPGVHLTPECCGVLKKRRCPRCSRPSRETRIATCQNEN